MTHNFKIKTANYEKVLRIRNLSRCRHVEKIKLTFNTKSFSRFTQPTNTHLF